jgi:methylenetetrahydrofolate dehydrogenase (NADP+)/methenyltetrahydrofolate cyclohydrolase
MLLYGKPVAEKLRNQTTTFLRQAQQKIKDAWSWYVAHLLLADDPATLTYAQRKADYAQKLWISSHTTQCMGDSSSKVLSYLNTRSNDEHCVGIIVQLPVWSAHQEYLNTYIAAIPRHKDIDWLWWMMMGKSVMGTTSFIPATPRAVVEVYTHYTLPSWKAKHIVILWQSNLIGKPLALLAMSQGATLTSVNVDTTVHTLMAAIADADIIISATWSHHLITKEILEKSSTYSSNPLAKKIIMDVGWWVRDGKAIGDCDRQAIEPLVQAITPVPWWIGPVTIASVFDNIRVLREICAWKIH